ncbi:MAG: prepilin-type N-terminal cleavage/methylation domain-containing protein [Solirubrobacterales bacterium]|nr:prepilin-type N-terminal cleavage/methylation domain-containing protein [Solirubrobacterales bacterium]
MTHTTDTHKHDRQAGFTLVELVVGVGLAFIALLAILLTLDSFSSNTSRQTRRTDANDQVRRAMDRIVSDLRQAATIEVAEPNNLLYSVKQSATVTRRERICLDAANNLWRSSVTNHSYSFLASCPSPGSSAAQIGTLVSANTASNPIFRYDAAPPGVRSVGLTFALNAGTRNRNDVSTLRASTFVRAKSEMSLGVPRGAITTTCSSSGVPTLTLSSSVGPLNVSYTDTDGSPIGTTVSSGIGVTLPVTTTSTTVVANVTSSGGLVSQILKTIECPL